MNLHRNVIKSVGAHLILRVLILCISASTGNIVLAQQRYNALKQLKHSVQSIKLRDEKKDTTQNVLIQVKNILETL